MSYFEDLVSAPIVVSQRVSRVLDGPPREEEARHVAGAVEKRRTDFLLGRECAHEALRRAGKDIPTVAVGERGEPVWPPDVRGSISHCCGLVACAIAPKRRVSYLGIDVEKARPLPPGVRPMIATSDEVERAEQELAGRMVPADLLIFSAKEALYKAIHHLVHRWVDFGEAVVTVNKSGRFSATFAPWAGRLLAVPWTVLDGVWRVERGLLMTVVAPREFLREGKAGERQVRQVVEERL